MGRERLYCPECGEELGWRDDVYIFDGGDSVMGCSQCLQGHNAVEWFDAQAEAYAESQQDYWTDA